MNDKNDKEIMNFASKKPTTLEKTKKIHEMLELKPNRTLEININEILMSTNVFVNNFNTAKYASKQQFELNPLMKISFIKNTPNNKLSDFIIPIECKGDDGEIPEIEQIFFEKTKNFKNIGIGTSFAKQKAISLHLNREIGQQEGIGSPKISNENEIGFVGEFNKNMKGNLTNKKNVNSFQKIIGNKQV